MRILEEGMARLSRKKDAQPMFCRRVILRVVAQQLRLYYRPLIAVPASD